MYCLAELLGSNPGQGLWVVAYVLFGRAPGKQPGQGLWVVAYVLFGRAPGKQSWPGIAGGCICIVCLRNEKMRNFHRGNMWEFPFQTPDI